MTLHNTPLTKTSRPTQGRAVILFLLLFLLIAAPFGGAGCAPGSLLGPQISVSSDPAQALKDGDSKEKLALQAEATGSKTEAQRIWSDAATYYGAVEKKYDGQSTGLIAAMAAARVEADHLDQAQQAWAGLKPVVKKYPVGSLGTSTLPNDLQAYYAAIIAKLDAENSKTLYFKAMDFLVHKCAGGNAVFSLFIVAVAVTLLTWPLRKQVLKQSREMQRYMPEMKKIQEKYKEDLVVYQEKISEFNKKHGINPAAGCLPALAQWPITLLMYQVILHYQFHFTNDHFLWINPALGNASLNWPAPFKGAIGHSLAETDLILMAAYVLSMFLQMRFTPASSPDPQAMETQKQMSVMMPIMFFFIMYNGGWASAFVLYWFMSNILTLGQQWIINRGLPKVEPLILDANGDVVNGGGGAATLTANPRLISPKNSRKK